MTGKEATMPATVTRLVSIAAAAVLLLSTSPATAAEAAPEDDRSGWEDASARDPLEGLNRGFFWFNDKLDVYALAPVARGWDWLAPDPVQDAITNFFDNLRFPVHFANNLLQGKFGEGSTVTGRFVINTTVGVAGLFDPAGHWGLERAPEDFGQTLGWWGSPPGPYLVLPLLGPLNLRDGGGMVVDWGFSVLPLVVNGWVLMGGNVVNTVNSRAGVLQEIDDAKAASLDYYVFVRNAYFQRRQALIRDIAVDQPSARRDDLYDDSWDDTTDE